MERADRALVTQFATHGTFLISQAADAGVWVLLAIGLNVVVGFAGLLDLGYAAFFAIGAYTYALFASDQLGASPLHVSTCSASVDAPPQPSMYMLKSYFSRRGK